MALVERCYIDIDPNLQLLLAIYNLKYTEEKDLISFMESRKLIKDEKEKILEIFNKLNVKVKNKEIEILKETLNLFKSKSKSKDLWLKNYSQFKKLENNNLFVELLIEGNMALLNKNDTWFKRVVKKLIKIPPELIAAEMSVVDAVDWAFLEKSLPNILNRFKANIKDQKYFSFLLLNLSVLLKSSKVLNRYLIKNESSFSLNDIKIFSRNNYFGKLFPVLWYSEIKKRSDIEEAEKFIYEIFPKLTFKSEKAQDLYILKYGFPKEDVVRKYVLKNILKLKESHKARNRFLFDRLIDVSLIKQGLSKIDNLFLKPKFLIRRNLALRSLRDKKFIDYNLYRLFSLGNYNRELLLWKIL